jgi:hypothetical protein
VQRFLAGALQPGNVCRIFGAFQQFLVILDRKNYGNGLAFAGDNLWFKHSCLHGV